MQCESATALYTVEPLPSREEVGIGGEDFTDTSSSDAT